MTNNNYNNIATCIHLSTFSRFFVPFGNFIAPLILWMVNKDKSKFIDAHGKQAINFQISILLYSCIIGIITVPFFLFNFLSHFDIMNFNLFESINLNISNPTPLFYIGGSIGFLAVIGFILEIVFIIKASLSAKDGLLFEYPLTINFIK